MSGLKGVNPPVKFGERTRDCSPGQAGKEGAAISSSVVPFSSCPQSLLASESFPMSQLCMRWPKYWSFSFTIIPSKEIPGLISFRMDWLDLLAVQGTLKSLLHFALQGGTGDFP